MSITQLDRRYLAKTYSRFPMEFSHGKGSTVYDKNGKEYIDLGSGIAVNIFGLSDESWKAAVTAQLDCYQHCSNLYCSEPVVKAAQLLCEKSGMERVFFSNSGAEANECAIKAARKWAAEHKGPEYQTIVTLNKSFHGRTLATLAATGQEVYHKDYAPLPTGFRHVDVGNADQLEQLVQEVPCAAVMIECVQGEGGVMPIGQSYANEIRRICEKYELLLICDEVQLGNGRSGKLFGYMHYGLAPDLVTTAKGLGGGLPIGATLFGARTADTFRPGDHGSTFGGNAVCCAGAVNILSRIDDELLSGVLEREAYIRHELEGAPGILAVNGMGLMLGLSIPFPARPFAERLLEKGVLVTTAKDKIRLLPALNIPMEQLKTAVRIIKDCAQEETV